MINYHSDIEENHEQTNYQYSWLNNLVTQIQI